MQRGVIHYDELTECGLFKDASGHIHTFRKGDPVFQHVWTYEVAEKPPVAVSASSQRPPIPPAMAVVKPLVPTSRPGSTSSSPTSRLSILNWAGLALSGLALLLLINIGGEPRKDGVGTNPKLIDSIWAVIAGVLLLIQLIYFSVGAARWRIRTNYWGIVVCTVFASVLMKGCDHYQADKVADVYTIVLAILLLVVYLLPKQKNG
ncbi:hypothetical protein [Larkinella rosea]|uniref:Uncharacterized protein n=1 Tax=Larkinella rosea TaxID=2025312 RepID=A0A3P1BA32_9BACT|nr:hypothetical protein [Larkinella rosea]RRA97662.1 hypothetical protein EHT25_31955 [Larkinella rosea]